MTRLALVTLSALLLAPTAFANGASTSTQVLDEQDCIDIPWGPNGTDTLTVCFWADGVVHETQTPEGRVISLFVGANGVDEYFNGELFHSFSLSAHPNLAIYNPTNDFKYLRHADLCIEDTFMGQARSTEVKVVFAQERLVLEEVTDGTACN